MAFLGSDSEAHERSPTVDLIDTVVGFVYARQAAVESRRSLQLQEAETARRAEFECPGLTAEYEVERGEHRVSIVLA